MTSRNLISKITIFFKTFEKFVDTNFEFAANDNIEMSFRFVKTIFLVFVLTFEFQCYKNHQTTCSRRFDRNIPIDKFS